MTGIMVTNANKDLTTTYKNVELRKATDRIFKIGADMRKSAFATAAIIAMIDANKDYVEDGFETVHDWTAQAFGFKKSASYNMLRVGREYVLPVLGSNGRIKEFQSNLLPEGSPVDFSVAQVIQVFPLGHDEAEKAVIEGKITPEMSCREIAKVVKDIRAIDAEVDEAEEVEEVKEAEEVEEVKEAIVIVTDANGNEYAIPSNVLNQYKI